MFGEAGEVEGVPFNERKVDSYLLYAVQETLKKSEQREDKRHYDETLTVDHNETFSSHNVEWRLENLPNSVFKLKFALTSKRGEKRGCGNLSTLSLCLFFFLKLFM